VLEFSRVEGIQQGNINGKPVEATETRVYKASETITHARSGAKGDYILVTFRQADPLLAILSGAPPDGFFQGTAVICDETGTVAMGEGDDAGSEDGSEGGVDALLGGYGMRNEDGELPFVPLLADLSAMRAGTAAPELLEDPSIAPVATPTVQGLSGTA
jgi:hypothetical protein